MSMPHYIIFFSGICLLTGCLNTVPKAGDAISVQAIEVHREVLTMDTHADINVKNFTDSLNYSNLLETQLNLPKMEEGGLDAVWLIVYTGQDSLTVEGYSRAAENARAKFEAIHRLCREYAPSRIALAVDAAQADSIYKSGKKVALIGVENAYPMGEDLSNFEKYHALGARYVSFAHNGHNQFCDSHTGEENNTWLHHGLSPLGVKAVSLMNSLGMLIDVSHLSKESIRQIIGLTKAPIIASHSSARALCDHSRNLDDEQLNWIRENGGVVQTVAFPTYLNLKKDEARKRYMEALYMSVADSLGLPWYSDSALDSLGEAAEDAFLEIYPLIVRLADRKAASRQDVPEAVNVRDLVDHIDYMVKLIGIDHVGISSDFDGGGGIEGWADASETLNVTRELLQRGYSPEEVRKLWGANILRVLEEAAALAQSMESP